MRIRTRQAARGTHLVMKLCILDRHLRVGRRGRDRRRQKRKPSLT
jgi:hypothetical protein